MLSRKGACNRNSDRKIYLVMFGHCKTNPLCTSLFQYFCSDWDCLEKRLSLGQCLVKNPCFNMECYPAKLQHQKCSTDITGKILLICIFYNLKNRLCQCRHMCQKPSWTNCADAVELCRGVGGRGQGFSDFQQPRP